MPDTQWHFLVGVCDQANGKVILYVDGTNAAQGSITVNAGIHPSLIPMTIGARMSGAATAFDYQFLGRVDDVAIVPNAVSAAQVSSLYSLSKYAPVITQQPNASWVGFTGGNATNSVNATGPGLSFQWYGPAGLLAGATNTSLVLTNLAFQQQGAYSVVVSNVYGAVQSATAVLSVVISGSSYGNAVLAYKPLAYWRLNETNGTVAFDSISTNHGVYTNAALGLPGYDSEELVKTDPFEVAALFGSNGTPSMVLAPASVDVSTQDISSARFSIAAWIKKTGPSTFDYGIVTKGAGGSDEEFMLGGWGDGFRFFVRSSDSAGQQAYITTSRDFPVNTWHFVMGVCDQTNSRVSLYVDGRLEGQTTIPFNRGIHHSSEPVAIGARRGQNVPNSPYEIQFTGLINDVTIFTNAFTDSQVAAIYNTAKPGPAFLQQPSPFFYTTPGGSVTNSVGVGGQNVVLQWYGPSGALAGKTNTTLILSNVQPVNVGPYYVIISNSYGTAQSSSPFLSLIYTNASPYSQAVQGLSPLGYWKLDETNGYMAFNSAGPNHGVYTNTLLGQPGPDSQFGGTVMKAAEFGKTNGLQSYVSVPNVNFGANPNVDARFTVSLWVKATGALTPEAGIINRGKRGDEQFGIDCGGPNNALRFYVRPYYGAFLNGMAVANTSVVLDNNWHHLVGVCHQPADSFTPGTVALYIDGTNAATATLNDQFSSSGIYPSSGPMTIGARSTSDAAGQDLQFVGKINQVAIFPAKLDPTQIAALYNTENALLELNRIPPASISLRWPVGFQLQYASNLTSGNWFIDTSSVTTSNSIQSTVLPIDAAIKFFRTRQTN